MRPVHLILLHYLVAAVSIAQPVNAVKLDTTPRLGILVPLGPPDYKVLLDALDHAKLVNDGPFVYRTGEIHGIPVALIIQDTDGDLIRSLGAQEMLRAFNIRALIYAGTSGGHLPGKEMGVGDIVLGAKTVNHANYHIAPNGDIQAGAFDAMQPGLKHYNAIYADPILLGMLACAAHRVSSSTNIPASWVPIADDAHPQIFYYGIQGSSTIWSDNQAYTLATMKVFHEIDEDGDWDSGFVAMLFHVPFIEVSVISNSIFAFPDANHGTPLTPPDQPNSHVFAQRMSNRITLDLIAHSGKQILAGTYTTPTVLPFAEDFFDHPKNPHDLLKGCL